MKLLVVFGIIAVLLLAGCTSTPHQSTSNQGIPQNSTGNADVNQAPAAADNTDSSGSNQVVPANQTVIPQANQLAEDAIVGQISTSLFISTDLQPYWSKTDSWGDLIGGLNTTNYPICSEFKSKSNSNISLDMCQVSNQVDDDYNNYMSGGKYSQDWDIATNFSRIGYTLGKWKGSATNLPIIAIHVSRWESIDYAKQDFQNDLQEIKRSTYAQKIDLVGTGNEAFGSTVTTWGCGVTNYVFRRNNVVVETTYKLPLNGCPSDSQTKEITGYLKLIDGRIQQ